jgi:integrase
MQCKKCKEKILDDSVFCSFCGVKQNEQSQKNSLQLNGGEKKYKYERVTFYFDGKQYNVSGKTKKEAHAKAAKKQFELENALAAKGGNMTVKKWALDWFDTYKAPAVGEGQYQNYMSHINGVIIPSIGNKKLKDVQSIDLQKILNSRSNKSKSDLSKLRILIQSIFKRARISRLIPYDPSEDLILPTAENGSYRSITQEERKAILKLANTHYSGLWIKTLLYCGLRPGETRALDWGHIDFEKRLLYVERAMKAATTRIDAPKSGAGVRYIPIPDKLYADFMSAKKELSEPVFIQPTTGKRHTKESMRCLWENFRRQLDISSGAKLYRNKIIESKIAPDLVPYCLRHTFGTDLQDAGVPINIAKYLMGHSDIKMTANVYTDTTLISIQNAAEKINKFVENNI